MGHVVYLDLGGFDLAILDFGTKVGAKQYRKHLQPFCKYKLKIAPVGKIREIEGSFRKDTHCTGIKRI